MGTVQVVKRAIPVQSVIAYVNGLAPPAKTVVAVAVAVTYVVMAFAVVQASVAIMARA